MTVGAPRILILAPHPDDEVVACGIAGLRARAAGAWLFVLYLTTGVPPREALWPWRRAGHAARIARRREEAEQAARLLGLAPVGFRATPSRRLRHELDAAAGEVELAIARCAATMLWVPAFEGGHQDHDAATALAASFRTRLPVWEFAAYHCAAGQITANRFVAERGGEIAIAATPREAALKRLALQCYISERANLRHVGTARESCRPLARYDYARRPHPGRLFRERFQRMPLRHPRVDYAPSATVYRDIAAWASTRGLGRATPLDEPRG